MLTIGDAAHKDFAAQSVASTFVPARKSADARHKSIRLTGGVERCSLTLQAAKRDQAAIMAGFWLLYSLVVQPCWCNLSDN
jgi:hypothetical protein